MLLYVGSWLKAGLWKKFEFAGKMKHCVNIAYGKPDLSSKLCVICIRRKQWWQNMLCVALVEICQHGKIRTDQFRAVARSFKDSVYIIAQFVGVVHT